ncbi:stage II sporulation protein M [Methanolacinia petrolearia]|uniref:stage II sporulation protein M n=1 Tax=Methanolacinia petrolearia TaxID=54120 RepID=UPI003BAB1772
MFDKKLSYSISFSLVIFVVFLAIGALTISQNSESAETLIQALNDDLFSYINSQDSATMAVTLFINNLEASILLFIGGATFGVVTMIVLLTNGVIIGFVLEYAAKAQGVAAVAAGIIPHGIFEIPAFIISSGLGFLLAESLWMEYKGMDDAAEYAGKLAKVFLMIVIPLLAAAAIIEAFITPQIIDLVVQGV